MSRFRTRPVFIWITLLSGNMLGCDTGLGAPPATAWEGELLPTEAATDLLSGSVAAISQARSTEASIQIIDGASESRYLWQVRVSTCEESGDLIGGRASYPELVTDATGGAVASAVLSERMQADDLHHAAVLAVGSGDTAIVACGELDQF